MKPGDLMIRDDGTKFDVVEVNHWTLVIAQRMFGVEDRVKFLWTDPKGDQYVGHYGGHGYTLVEQKP
jgi:hypothetical protein